jgi:hypothetical protein
MRRHADEVTARNLLKRIKPRQVINKKIAFLVSLQSNRTKTLQELIMVIVRLKRLSFFRLAGLNVKKKNRC